MSIYKLMKTNWKTYCLMSAIAYIEEMSKPKYKIEYKTKNDKTYKCNSFKSIRLKMKDKEFVDYLFNITKNWEKNKNIRFIGKSYEAPKLESYDGQYSFCLSPLWINYILSECGNFPNEYSYSTALKRIEYMKHYEIIDVDKNKFLFDSFFNDKKLAAGAFIISLDLECRGVQSGRISLCMSKPFKDFLQFMLNVANYYGWTTTKKLMPVSVEYSRNLGIKASDQYQFNVSIKGLQEIYKLAGPLIIRHKDKCINFHVKRSQNYVNLGGKGRFNFTRDKIFNEFKNKKDLTTTQLQFLAGVGSDVVLDHLNKLHKEGKISKIRQGKRYIWNLINFYEKKCH